MFTPEQFLERYFQAENFLRRPYIALPAYWQQQAILHTWGTAEQAGASKK
jgi:hypothetical protein